MDVLGIVTSVIGVRSLLTLIYQSINLRATIDNQIYQSLTSNSVEVDKILAEYLNVRKYVYDNATIDDETEDLDRNMSVVEMIIDIAENIEV